MGQVVCTWVRDRKRPNMWMQPHTLSDSRSVGKAYHPLSWKHLNSLQNTSYEVNQGTGDKLGPSHTQTLHCHLGVAATVIMDPYSLCGRNDRSLERWGSPAIPSDLPHQTCLMLGWRMWCLQLAPLPWHRKEKAGCISLTVPSPWNKGEDQLQRRRSITKEKVND